MIDLNLELITHLIGSFAIGFGLGAVAGGVVAAIQNMGDAMSNF